MKKDDKARVRVFFGEIEGDNETIRDGLRSIAEAVNKTFQQETRVVKVIAAGGNLDQKQLTTELENQILEAELAEEETQNDSSEPINGRQRGKVTSKKKFPSYSFVKDLNLYPDGKQNLRQFYMEKNPSDQQQVLTVVIYYLYRVLEIDKVTVNHVYTGLKELTELGVRVPNDIPQILRNISGRKGWVDTSDTDSLKTTIPGDNFIEHDLPKAKGEKAQDQN
jgi:hypothetical protein